MMVENLYGRQLIDTHKFLPPSLSERMMVRMMEQEPVSLMGGRSFGTDKLYRLFVRQLSAALHERSSPYILPNLISHSFSMNESEERRAWWVDKICSVQIKTSKP